MSALTVQFASWPDEEELVAELIIDDEYVGHVVRVGRQLQVTIYPQPATLHFDLTALEGVIARIRERLDARFLD